MELQTQLTRPIPTTRTAKLSDKAPAEQGSVSKLILVPPLCIAESPFFNCRFWPHHRAVNRIIFCENIMTQEKPVHNYHAFGLGIESQLRLPELKVGVAAPEVTVRFGNILLGDGVGLESGSIREQCVKARQDEVQVFWKGEASFLMRHGREIIVQPEENVPESVLRMGVLGPGIAAILQQRGHLVLHASAVVIGGRAVGFVGWKGRGKSTTAASLFVRGCPLLTDDLLALNGEVGKPILAHPSLAQFKLWPDSAETALSEAAETLPRLHDAYEKRAKSVVNGFAPEPVPLAAIYVLGLGSEPAVHRLSPQESFREIVSHTFCARYGNQVFAGSVGATHLQNVARLIANVPVFRLERADSLRKLQLFADFVMQHARCL